jgi:hypothetical protein
MALVLSVRLVEPGSKWLEIHSREYNMPNVLRRSFVLHIAFSLVLCAPTTTWAQSGQGVVEGSISDENGALLPGANVTLANESTSVAQLAVTNSHGTYQFPLVPPGTYTITVNLTGFVPRRNTGVVVDASKTISVDLRLHVGGVTSTVEVTATDPLVQVASSQLTTSIDKESIANTPLLSRDVYDLVFIAPAVTQGVNGNPAAGGVRESGTGFLLNGADNNDNFGEGQHNISPPVESVSEVTVITNSMSAQYGRSAGAVISAVQKAGGNKYHGVLYEFNRNRALEANDFLDKRTGAANPVFNRNQFGGEIDGPIIKDKTFFAFAYDQVILHTASPSLSAVRVFTPSALASLQATTSPLAQAILKAYPQKTSTTPCPNQQTSAPGSIANVGCISVVDPQSDPLASYYGRVDQNFSRNNRLSLTLNVTREAYKDSLGGGHPTSTTNIPLEDDEHYHAIALVDTHVFTPHVVNEATLAHNRHYSNRYEGTGASSIPEISIDGTSDGLGIDGIGPYEGNLLKKFTQDRWLAQDNLIVTRGEHTIRFGGAYQYGILYRNFDAGSPGFYEFSNIFGASATACGCQNPDGSVSNVPVAASNFQRDFPYYLELSIDPRTGNKANAYFHYAYTDGSFFINEEWKTTPRLTLSLGLRWERFGSPHEVSGRLSNFPEGTDLTSIAGVAAAQLVPVKTLWHAGNHDFSPRIGFAYDVFGNGKTAIRGNYGTFYDRLFDYVWSNVSSNPPFYAISDLNALGAGSDSVYYSLPPSLGSTYIPNSIPSPAHRVGIKTVDPNLKDASAQSFFLGLEQAVTSQMLIHVSYQASLGRHLAVLVNPNRFDGIANNATLHLTRPNPSYNIGDRENILTSNYHSGTLEIQKRLDHGLQLQGSYVFSKLLDYGSDFFTGDSLRAGLNQPYYAISNSRRYLEYGPGAFDHTHSFKLNAVYSLPSQHELPKLGLLGKAVGDWTAATFFQSYAGHPLNVYSSRTRYAGNAFDAAGNAENIGGDYNLDSVGNDHPNFTGPSLQAFYSHKTPADGIFKDNNPIGCGFPGARSTNIAQCNSDNGVTTPNAYFTGPAGSGVKYGTLGRNVFRGPWFNSINVSLTRAFNLSESIRLQLRGDAFNLFNHPNFDNIVTDLASSQFGQATELVHDGSTSQADPGSISRRFQLGARLTF